MASPLVDPPPAKPNGGTLPPPTGAAPERGIGTGVTEKIAPPGPPPPKCNMVYAGKFGIAVQNITDKVVPPAAPATLPVPTPPKIGMTPAETTPPSPPGGAVGLDTPPPDQDGVSTRMHTRTVTVRRTVVGSNDMKQSAYMVSQIADGQIQAPTTPTPLERTTSAPSPAVVTPGSPEAVAGGSGLVSQIGDGQIQAPVAPKPAGAAPDVEPKPAANATHPAAAPAAAVMPPLSAMAMRRDLGVPPPEKPSAQFVACITNGTLTVTLDGGVLKDDKGRTGYIASNYQFQFDAPPQSGSIYTAGFSVCSNGSLALGGSTVWYQCRSGDFYNLYDRWWAPQCNPVTINAVMLKQC
ncbi:hypothetical protein FKW77_008420 [Venturia effusa]|uniref:Cell wall mannoprotein PIR1-like C-terminal domain-containing protein n=1 Tax=Venturia effusa TaxID=50376 RepID=A0A517LG19_9PEZI|nr:hypothetical protein FKW77_008420 [Venturia effusa]